MTNSTLHNLLGQIPINIKIADLFFITTMESKTVKINLHQVNSFQLIL